MGEVKTVLCASTAAAVPISYTWYIICTSLRVQQILCTRYSVFYTALCTTRYSPAHFVTRVEQRRPHVFRRIRQGIDERG